MLIPRLFVGFRGLEMTVVVLSKYWIVTLLCLLVAVTALATADTIPLTSNNLGISRSVDSLTLTQSMNSGYTFKLQRGRFGFDVETPLQLRPRHNSWRRHNLHGSPMDLAFQHLKTTQNVSHFGSFSFDLANPMGGPKGITSADQFSFFTHAAGFTVSQLLTLDGKGNALFHRFCAGGGTNCAPSTGFAAGAPKPTAVPESGTLNLLGTALLAAAGMIRRRFQ